MTITQKKLKEVFRLLPSVDVFLSNKERSLAFASSLKDIGGRDDDVFDNIKYVCLKKGIKPKKDNIGIVIEKFYRLGSKTIMQINIGGGQKPIDNIIKEALDSEFLSEMGHAYTDYFKLADFYTALSNIVGIVYNVDAKPIINIIEPYIYFIKYIIHNVKIANADNATDKTAKEIIMQRYNALINGRYSYDPKYGSKVCSLLDLCDILCLDNSASDVLDNVIPRETIYPVDMTYKDNQFCTDFAGTISNKCFYVNEVARDNTDLDSLVIDTNGSVTDLCDSIFAPRTSAIIKYSISKHLNVSVDITRTSVYIKRTVDKDIVIKFCDGINVLCLARITPTSDFIVWSNP